MNNVIDLNEIVEKVYQKVVQEITEAYNEKKLDEVLKKYGLEDEIDYPYYDINNSKILVVGNSVVNKDILISIAKNMVLERID